MTTTLRIGTPVLYTLTKHDAELINKRRQDAATPDPETLTTLAAKNTGAQIHVGNTVHEGDQYPGVVVRVFEAAHSANLRVWLDGNDDFWACSKSEGEGPNTWQVQA